MALREVLARLGIQVDDSQLHKANHSLHGLIGTLRTAAHAAGVFFVVEGLHRMVDGVTESADRIDKLAIQLGIARQALQEWGLAAELAGVDQSALANAFGLLTRNAFQAKRGSKEMADAFRQIGVTTTDANGRLKDSDTLMAEVGAGLSGVSNESERTALALTILGRSGKQMLPLFEGGAEGIAKAREELAKVGGGISDEAIDRSREFRDNITRMQAAMRGLQTVAVLQALPALSRIVEHMSRGIVAIRRFDERTGFLGKALTLLGILAAAAAIKIIASFAPVVAPIAAIIAGVTVLWLWIDDLITLFRGGDSVIGDFIDTMFGMGAAKAMVKEVTDAWDGMLLVVKKIANGIAFITGQDPIFDEERIPGFETYEDALKRARAANAAKTRAAAGGIGGTGAALATLPGQRRVAAPGRTAGGQVVNQETTANITVHAPNADPKEVARRVAEQVQKHRDKELTRAHAALVPVAGG